MAFDKEDYRARRNAGVRGQGDPLPPPLQVIHVGNRMYDRVRRFARNRAASKKGYKNHAAPFGKSLVTRAHGKKVLIANARPY